MGEYLKIHFLSVFLYTPQLYEKKKYFLEKLMVWNHTSKLRLQLLEKSKCRNVLLIPTEKHFIFVE